MNKTILCLILCYLISGCTKFEEGPAISILPKKQKICQTWKIESITFIKEGLVYTKGFDNWTIAYNKNGKFIRSVVYNGVEIKDGETEGDRWDFSGGTGLALNYTKQGTLIIEQYTIIRLSNKQLWLRNDAEEIHYIAK